jgi:hypothetical protein
MLEAAAQHGPAGVEQARRVGPFHLRGWHVIVGDRTRATNQLPRELMQRIRAPIRNPGAPLRRGEL